MNKQQQIAVGIASVSLLVTGVSVWAFEPFQLKPESSEKTSVTLAQPQIDKKIPQSAYACLPTRNVKMIELQSSVSDKQRDTYYLLRVTGENNQYGEPLIQVSAQGNCTTLITVDEITSLSQHVPVELAQQLALGALTKDIQQTGSKEKYQKYLEELSEGVDGELYYPSEYIWAMKQLGIQLPKNTVTLQESRRSTDWNE